MPAEESRKAFFKQLVFLGASALKPCGEVRFLMRSVSCAWLVAFLGSCGGSFSVTTAQL